MGYLHVHRQIRLVIQEFVIPDPGQFANHAHRLFRLGFWNKDLCHRLHGNHIVLGTAINLHQIRRNLLGNTV